MDEFTEESVNRETWLWHHDGNIMVLINTL